MRSALACVAFGLLLASAAHAETNPVVVLETSLGEIELELFAEQAPVSVENFLAYVDAGFYDGTIFHRVIAGYVIQAGGFTVELNGKLPRAAIVNEADHTGSNARGTLAMARRSAVDSATAQFFINLNDNAFLDHGARDFGYAVFGRVTRGMDVVDAIAAVPIKPQKGHAHAPVKAVEILRAERSSGISIPDAATDADPTAP